MLSGSSQENLFAIVTGFRPRMVLCFKPRKTQNVSGGARRSSVSTRHRHGEDEDDCEASRILTFEAV
eukprot:scaffold301_cov243-Pinguiococcus_pyrenoidosus.AAC.43